MYYDFSTVLRKEGPTYLTVGAQLCVNTQNKISEKKTNITPEVLLLLSLLRCNSHYSENLADRASCKQRASYTQNRPTVTTLGLGNLPSGHGLFMMPSPSCVWAIQEMV